jgi:NADH:ubiquinone oxidoreductase subunit 5 (subunit L)/multisubunit Na+/H+ antiporter MnhA subunit
VVLQLCFAGTVGVFQNDLKRVIAYSTCSQLGYMVPSFVVYLIIPWRYFHLLNHAFF